MYSIILMRPGESSSGSRAARTQVRVPSWTWHHGFVAAGIVAPQDRLERESPRRHVRPSAPLEIEQEPGMTPADLRASVAFSPPLHDRHGTN